MPGNSCVDSYLIVESLDQQNSVSFVGCILIFVFNIHYCKGVTMYMYSYFDLIF